MNHAKATPPGQPTRHVKMSDTEVTARNLEVAAFEAKKLANAWLAGRKSEYPSVPDQLDKIYHEGLDAWKAEIKLIKDKYPKPT